MYRDPVVEEVRNARREIMAECHDDADEYLQRIRKVQKRFKDRLVRGQPKPALRSEARA